MNEKKHTIKFLILSQERKHLTLQTDFQHTRKRTEVFVTALMDFCFDTAAY